MVNTVGKRIFSAIADHFWTGQYLIIYFVTWYINLLKPSVFADNLLPVTTSAPFSTCYFMNKGILISSSVYNEHDVKLTELKTLWREILRAKSPAVSRTAIPLVSAHLLPDLHAEGWPTHQPGHTRELLYCSVSWTTPYPVRSKPLPSLSSLGTSPRVPYRVPLYLIAALSSELIVLHIEVPCFDPLIEPRLLYRA